MQTFLIYKNNAFVKFNLMAQTLTMAFFMKQNNALNVLEANRRQGLNYIQKKCGEKTYRDSLAVHWLELCAFIARAGVQSLVQELRF